MKILIISQNESLYLPSSFGRVCSVLRAQIACIVCAPAMSTHGGAIPGLLRHLRLFGLKDTLTIALRTIRAKLKDIITTSGPDGPFYSIRAVASGFDIPYYDIKRLAGPEFHSVIDGHRPDLLISLSCPQIIGKKIRDRFPKGCINVHGAPLPKYRGLMPAFWMLRNGETTTAVTVHDLADKLDNGAILLQYPVAIDPDDTWDSLVRKTKAAGAEALIEGIRRIEDGSIARKDNRDEDATYFSFPTAADAKIFRSMGRRFF